MEHICVAKDKNGITCGKKAKIQIINRETNKVAYLCRKHSKTFFRGISAIKGRK